MPKLTITLCPLQHIYLGQPYARVDLNPMPESTLSPLSGTLGLAPDYQANRQATFLYNIPVLLVHHIAPIVNVLPYYITVKIQEISLLVQSVCPLSLSVVPAFWTFSRLHCWGAGSETGSAGSACFWASWIRIH
jgi:hypothetical protein